MNSTSKFLVYLTFILVFSSSISSAFLSSKKSFPITKLRATDAEGDLATPDMGDVGFVLLAGGTGSRMKASMRKFLF